MSLHVLSDGTQVEIRPIQIGDGTKLRQSHARLSPESRYRRFLAAKPQLTEADARYLVDIDGSDHFALVATLAEPLDGEPDPIIAVTRYIRLPEQPDTAEFAIVVGDRWQRQGLAFELLSRLADAATEHGIRRFHATLLADNIAVLRLMSRVGAGAPAVRSLGPISEAEVELTTADQADRRRAPAIIAGCAGS